MTKSELTPNVSRRSTGRGLGLIVALVGAWSLVAAAILFFPGLEDAQRFRGFTFSGLFVGVPFILWFTRDHRVPSALRGVGIGLATVLIVGTWTSVIQDGYYGDATPHYRWRPLSSSRIEAPETNPDRETIPVSSALNVPEKNYSGEEWNYAEFLGPNRDAKIPRPRLSKDWTAATPKVRWRVPVGEGWSSFALTERYAITQEQLGDNEAVVCRDLQSGNTNWKVNTEGVRFGETYGGFGPRATPTVFRDKVYTLGAEGDLQCIDLDSGELLWHTKTLTDANAKNIKWGMAGSPLVFDDTVVVCPGGENEYSVIAYNRTTGKIQWHAGSSKAAYSSPMLVDFGGTKQVVVLSGPGLESYDASEGTLLWDYPWVVNANMMTSITQPVVIQGKQPNQCRFFLSGGYGKGCVMIAVEANDAAYAVEECWAPNRQLKSKFNTMIHHDGFIYGMDDQILTCLDIESGTRCWKKGRYGYGQLLFVNDVLLIQAENGDVALVRPTPDEFEELTRISPLNRKTWNNPALRGNLLLVRNDQEAVCLELPVDAKPSL